MPICLNPTCQHFKNIYQYVVYNKVLASKEAIRKQKTTSHDYMILDTLLLKIIKDLSGEYIVLLYTSTSKVDMLLNHHHSFLVGDHAGVTKCYINYYPEVLLPKFSSSF